MRARSLRRLTGFLLTAAAILPASPATGHVPAAPAATAAATIGPLLPPVRPACVSSPFGPRILPHRPLAGTFHNGIDLPAPAGAPVYAVAAGRVIRAQRRGPGGLELLVQHHGFLAVYSHLGSLAPAIADGHRTLRAGEWLGVVGHSGLTYGMHLFFAIKRNGRFVNPAPYLGVTPCHEARR